ncbi:hypothetical protein [Thorsellia kenyensis]|uniref:PLD phosphodiesterase domain-containing protein n=1 Tax=Thorsellia kenyensis TaxID=1549888 RepID=A0ABV6CB61_9GAMM
MPGVMHFPFKDTTPAFNLMHAKVALLSFKNESGWVVRLIVSTGNWTNQTLEESLDLFWKIDVSQADLKTQDSEKLQALADVKAAWDFMRELKTHYNIEIINHLEKSNLKPSIEEFEQWLEYISTKAKGKPRFIDNRRKSFFEQLSPKLIQLNLDSKKNYIALGSGFFEGITDENFTESVPCKIVKQLCDEGLLTQNPTKELYINPNNCQFIAHKKDEILEHNYEIFPAYINTEIFGENISKSLHAKFIFSASVKDRGAKYSNGWVYIGSGNLTNKGFMNSAKTNRGNLEAGVIFATGDMLGEVQKGKVHLPYIDSLLPIHLLKNTPDITDLPLKEGEPFDEKSNPVYVASSLTHLIWNKEQIPSRLLACEAEQGYLDNFTVYRPNGLECMRCENGYIWEGEQPTTVWISWQKDRVEMKANIPIIDDSGRVAGTSLKDLTIEEAELQLLSFPHFLANDTFKYADNEKEAKDDNDSFDGEEDSSNYPSNIAIFSKQSNYHIRKIMSLIESIAIQQTRISAYNWDVWCARLEQTLKQMSTSECVDFFINKMKINPLTALYRDEFKPDFLNYNEAKNTKYEEMLERIQKAWNIDFNIKGWEIGDYNEH